MDATSLCGAHPSLGSRAPRACAATATVDVGDPVDQERVRTAVLELHGHIAKEEDGLFPASLTALTGEEWNASMQAWHDAHPGERMVGE